MGRPGAGRPPGPTVRIGWPGVGLGFSTGGGASYFGRSGATGTIKRRPPAAPALPGACGANFRVGVRKRGVSGPAGGCSPPGWACGVTVRGGAGETRGGAFRRGVRRLPAPGCAGAAPAGGGAGVAADCCATGGRCGGCACAPAGRATGATGGAGALYTGLGPATGIFGPPTAGEPGVTRGAGRIEG